MCVWEDGGGYLYVSGTVQDRLQIARLDGNLEFVVGAMFVDILLSGKGVSRNTTKPQESLLKHFLGDMWEVLQHMREVLKTPTWKVELGANSLEELLVIGGVGGGSHDSVGVNLKRFSGESPAVSKR